MNANPQDSPWHNYFVCNYQHIQDHQELWATVSNCFKLPHIPSAQATAIYSALVLYLLKTRMAWSQNGLVTEWLGHRARRMNNNDHLAHNPALQGSRGRVNNLQVSHFALQIEHQ